MEFIDDRHKHIVVANAKCPTRSDPNSIRYFLDLVNRIESLQEAVAHDLAEDHRLREQVSGFMQRGHW